MSWTDFVAGCIGGGASVFVGHPFDTIKVKLQTSNQTSLRNCIRNTYQHGKLSGFFRGMPFPVLSSGLINSIFFGAYGRTCTALGELNYADILKERRPHYGSVFVAGIIGGMVQMGIVIPVEVVKVKLQAQTPHSEIGEHRIQSRSLYRSSTHCFAQIWRTNGMRGLYQGSAVQFVRDVPAYGLYMVAYEFILYQLSKISDNALTNCLIAGGMAGSISWASIIPLDVAKSRIQAEDPDRAGRHSGMLRCMLDMYRRGGVAIFFRGLSLVTLRAFPVNAVQLALYSISLTFLNDRFVVT